MPLHRPSMSRRALIFQPRNPKQYTGTRRLATFTIAENLSFCTNHKQVNPSAPRLLRLPGHTRQVWQWRQRRLARLQRFYILAWSGVAEYELISVWEKLPPADMLSNVLFDMFALLVLGLLTMCYSTTFSSTDLQP